MLNLNLKKHYLKLQHYIEKNIANNEAIDDLSVIIYNNEWVRIYLQGQKDIKIQVEISLSSSMVEKLNTMDGSLQSLLNYQIKYLEYLLKLNKLGFSLGFIVEEGIWYCSKLLEQEPTQEFSEKIHPENYVKIEESK